MMKMWRDVLFTNLFYSFSYSLPINVVAVYKSSIFCCTVLGQMVVYNAKSGSILFDIAAHAKCINALDVAHEVGLVQKTKP